MEGSLMNAKPGEVVECINALPTNGWPEGAPFPLKSGQLYTVAAVGLTPGNKRPAYILEEVPHHGPWSQTRFRKLPPEEEKSSDWVEKMKKLGNQPSIDKPDEAPKAPVKVPEYEDA
jgi:hypothetical protein